MLGVTLATKGMITRRTIISGGIGGGAGPSGGYGSRDDCEIKKPIITVKKMKISDEKNILSNETLKVTGVNLIID